MPIFAAFVLLNLCIQYQLVRTIVTTSDEAKADLTQRPAEPVFSFYDPGSPVFFLFFERDLRFHPVKNDILISHGRVWCF